MEVNIFIAFLAGIISFLSPCIFPIIPSYIGYIGAATYDEGYKRNRGAFPLIIAFILGFTIVFTVMGVAFSTLGFAFKNYSIIITRVSGILVILLGLNSVFNFIKFLDYEKKVTFRSKNKGFISSLILGMAFGAGWSPCIGPILASILFLAGNSSTLLSGIILLLFFSLGLGIPFLLSGLFIASFREKSKGIKKHLGKIKVISGIFIIFIGVFIFFNKLSNLNIILYQAANSFSVWYEVNTALFNTVTGIINLIFVALLILKVLKNIKSDKRVLIPIIFTVLFSALSITSFFGTINWGNIILTYLTFQGI